MRPDFDHMLFDAEPPKSAQSVEKLFRGRQVELDRAEKTFKKGMDKGGARSERGFPKNPWVIHGESRSGKSHFARMLLTRFDQDARNVQVVVHARDQAEAIIVMRELFDTVYHDCFIPAVAEGDFQTPDWMKLRISVVEKVMRDIAHFSRGADKVSLSITSGDTAALKAGMEFSPLPKVLKLTMHAEAGQQASGTTTLSLPPPTPERYADYIGAMVTTLLDAQALDHCLILVDDADLLENELKDSPGGRRERNELAKAMVTLHGYAGVDVVLTSRSRYAHSNKELKDLLDLEDFPMKATDLTAIYRAHLDFYGSGQEVSNWSFLEETVIEAAAQHADYLPGFFLRFMEVAYKTYDHSHCDGKMSLEWYLEVFRNKVRELTRKYPAPSNALTECVRNGSMEYRKEGRDLFYGTELDNFLVCQRYHDDSIYRITPLAAIILRELAKQDETISATSGDETGP